MSQEEIDRAAVKKAVRVIGGLKSQLTVAAVNLEKVVEAGRVEPDDTSTVKASVKMVKRMVQRVEVKKS